MTLFPYSKERKMKKKNKLSFTKQGSNTVKIKTWDSEKRISSRKSEGNSQNRSKEDSLAPGSWSKRSALDQNDTTRKVDICKGVIPMTDAIITFLTQGG